MQYLIISSSLNKQSKSRILAQAAHEEFLALNRSVTFVDLQNYDLPLCDGGPSFKHPHVKELKHLIEKADALLLSSPVYNYSVGPALKNLFDLTTEAWSEKIVGLMLAGGGSRSFMAGMGFLNSIMINARCLVIPRFVFALEEEVGEHNIKPESIRRRIKELVLMAVDLSERLRSKD